MSKKKRKPKKKSKISKKKSKKPKNIMSTLLTILVIIIILIGVLFLVRLGKDIFDLDQESIETHDKQTGEKSDTLSDEQVQEPGTAPTTTAQTGTTQPSLPQITEQVIIDNRAVCNSPYIIHGTSCCLDQNSNSICDSDETVAVTEEDEIVTEEEQAEAEEEIIAEIYDAETNTCSNFAFNPPACDVCHGGDPMCDGNCVYYRGDPDNCGTCGNACAVSEACDRGECISECPGDKVICSGICVYLGYSEANCGSCGNACPDLYSCREGECECGSGVFCDDVCADPDSDENNCGECGNVCGDNQECRRGECETIVDCPVGQTSCSETCIDLLSDDNNCGGCGNDCVSGYACESGSCSCTLTYCTGMCIDLQISSYHCGSCGISCSSEESCIDGLCVSSESCQEGQTECSGSCVSLLTDENNCGSCGNDCGSFDCIAGACTSNCAIGESKCSGSCVDTTSDENNCGGCTTVCMVGQSCESGSCIDVILTENTYELCTDDIDNDNDDKIDEYDDDCVGVQCAKAKEWTWSYVGTTHFGRGCCADNECAFTGGNCYATNSLINDNYYCRTDRDLEACLIAEDLEKAIGNYACADAANPRWIDFEIHETSCTDGLDNDIDGNIDEDDSDCIGQSCDKKSSKVWVLSGLAGSPNEVIYCCNPNQCATSTSCIDYDELLTTTAICGDDNFFDRCTPSSAGVVSDGGSYRCQSGKIDDEWVALS